MNTDEISSNTDEMKDTTIAKVNSIQTSMELYEYIWLDKDFNFRSKNRILPQKVGYCRYYTFDELSWNYDGSSTGQATGDESEVVLKVVHCVKNPFYERSKTLVNVYLVLCATYNQKGEPLESNNYHVATQRFKDYLKDEPWFGLEQEYFLMDPKTDKPLGFTDPKLNDNKGSYYCGLGSKHIVEQSRKIVDEHMIKCVDIGLHISGTNAEVSISQWEFQVGPCPGIYAAHELWIARYILERVVESYGLYVSWHPKPIEGWNGSGCHTNYSTLVMRKSCTDRNGMVQITDAIKKLEKKHKLHMENYGTDNGMRMTGGYETSSADEFSWGIGSRGTSIRVGNETNKKGYGYFEDRRPASNCDPYLVTSLIYETTTV